MPTASTPSQSPPAGDAPSVRLSGAARIRGRLRVPGDKSISHRALMLALLAPGESRIRGAGDGADVRSTAGIVEALGATVERVVGLAVEPGAARGGGVDYRVSSPGVDELRAPDTVLDCGNSGTTLRLFARILAGLPGRATLDGDASLRRRPVARIIEPLRSMGAHLEGRDGDSRPPLTVVGHAPLTALDWSMPVASAQVKSAILLAALRADGTTRVRENVATRDHTERMLRARGVTVRTAVEPGGGRAIEVDGGAAMMAIDEQVPGDVSAAAFWLVAGAIHPDAELAIDGVGVNPTRRAVIDILRAMGAHIEERHRGVSDGGDSGEPSADLVVKSSSLRGIDLGPADVAAAIDELPVLCLAATQATGRTRVRGAGELRHKESDRLTGIAQGLAAMGASVSVDGDDITIDGRTDLRGAATDSLDDHRLAMTFAVGSLVAAGETSIAGAGSVGISYPAFFDDLERIRS